jgi:hypothetical protein
MSETHTGSDRDGRSGGSPACRRGAQCHRCPAPLIVILGMVDRPHQAGQLGSGLCSRSHTEGCEKIAPPYVRTWLIRLLPKDSQDPASLLICILTPDEQTVRSLFSHVHHHDGTRGNHPRHNEAQLHRGHVAIIRAQISTTKSTALTATDLIYGYDDDDLIYGYGGHDRHLVAATVHDTFTAELATTT